MHNLGLDETFFITQFIQGLKSELKGPVDSQVPESVDRAVFLAQVEQSILDKSKVKSSSKFSPSHANSYKPEAK